MFKGNLDHRFEAFIFNRNRENHDSPKLVRRIFGVEFFDISKNNDAVRDKYCLEVDVFHQFFELIMYIK